VLIDVPKADVLEILDDTVMTDNGSCLLKVRSLKNGADKLQSAMKLFKKRTSGRNS